METLVEFLKASTALDLLIVLVVVLVSIALVPTGIWIAIASRSRKPIGFVLLIGLLPLLLALLGTFWRIRSTEKAIAEFPDASAEVVAAARQEAWITTYIGAAGTVVVELIAVTGLILKKDRTELA